MKSKSAGWGRRAFLGVGLSAAAGCGTHGQSGWRFLTPGEGHTVEAICGRLIPADRDAGAREAGAAHYIDLQLGRAFRKHQKVYLLGIAGTDTTARLQFGKPFVELPEDQQDRVLATVEKSDRPFFELILAHTRQGFYGDPRHGGNRNMTSWKMLGLAYPPVRGRQKNDDSKG